MQKLQVYNNIIQEDRILLNWKRIFIIIIIKRIILFSIYFFIDIFILNYYRDYIFYFSDLLLHSCPFLGTECINNQHKKIMAKVSIHLFYFN